MEIQSGFSLSSSNDDDCDDAQNEIKCWEDISLIDGANILNDNEKKKIFETLFLEYYESNEFSFSYLILPNEKLHDLLFKTDFFEIIFNEKKFKRVLIDYEIFKIKINTKIINILKKAIIKEISFYGFLNFDDDSIHIIGDFIKSSNSIESLFIEKSNLIDNHIEILSKYLDKNEKIRSLSFSMCKSLTDKCNKYLIEISNKTSMESIKLDGTNIINKSVLTILLLDSFFKNGNKTIDFEDNGINDDTLNFLSESIIKNNINDIDEINISGNEITSKGIFKLFNSLILTKNKSIISIFVSSNKLDDDCISILGEIIKKNKNIRNINLSFNNISNKGVEILSEYVFGNMSINNLSLYGNPKITNESYSNIANMLETSYITCIDVHFTKISDDILAKIKEYSEIPINDRKIPLITNYDVKSASKIMRE